MLNIKMIYATVDDMTQRFGARELIALTDAENNAAIDAARVQRALDDARALVDGSVGVAYRLPLRGCAKPQTAPGAPNEAPTLPAARGSLPPEGALPALGRPGGGQIEYTAPPQLTRITCDIARYYLYPDLAPEHEVYRRYTDARNQLEAIAAGRAQLACPWGGSPGEPVASDAQSGKGVRYQFSARAITDEVAESYK